MARTIAELFWPRVNKTETCWLWTGPKINEYGRYPGGRLAHRVAWELCFGPVPKNTKVCHKCDVPLCVNPDHLFLGTQADNVADMVKKDRHAKHKLTEEQAFEIRRRYGAGNIRQRDLADEFGVCQQLVGNIVNGKIWKPRQIDALSKPANRLPPKS